ncbi:MAG TPA: tape measure protein [Geothrix sp.]|nr:tape measure protein [Geothrix sp.]
MTDLAKLTIAVDTRQVVSGGKDLDNLASKTERAEAAASRMGKVFAGLSLAAGVGIAGRQIWDTNKEFERLNTSLITVTKSQERANQVQADLMDFAAKTPFQLREVTEAYIMMRARGLDPTRATMTSLGNLASGMGRSFQDTIQAVGSLAAGEIEPMKQLGFSVMTIGDKVRISSEGVSRTVSRNAYDISKAVAQISDQKFGGGMERQINTLGGAWSNLMDQIDATIYKMGQAGFNTEARGAIQGLTEQINQATPAMARFAAEAVSGSVSAVHWLGEHQKAILGLGAAYATIKAGMAYGGVVNEFANPKTGSDAGLGSKIRGVTDYVQAMQLARAEQLAYAENEVRGAAVTLAQTRANYDAIQVQGAKSAMWIHQRAQEKLLATAQVEVTAATTAHTLATERQIAVQRANGAAATASAMASKGFGMVVNALGGPVGAVTTALVLGGTAAYLWGDKLKSSATVATENAEKLLVKLREEVQLLERRRSLATSNAPGAKQAASILDDDELKKTDDAIKAAGDFQRAIAFAQEDRKKYSEDSEDYIAAVQRESKAQAGLNKVMGKYSEIISKAQRRANVKSADAADAKAASDAEAAKLAEKAKREMKEQRDALEAQRLVEERKTLVRSLAKDNAEGLALIQSGMTGANVSKTEQDIIKLQADAKRLKLTASEMAVVNERIRQLRQEADAEKQRQHQDDMAQWNAEQDRKKRETGYEVDKAREAFMFSELDAATRLRDEDTKLAAQVKMLNQIYADGNVTEREYRDRMIELGKQAHIMTDTFGDLRDTINDWSRQGTDAMVDFFFTGKNGFSDMISSWLRDLARLTVQRNVMDPLTKGLTGFDWGSLFGGSSAALSTVNLPQGIFDLPAASGGYRSGNLPYLVGENGPEIFSPGRPGTITPNGAIGGQTINVSMSVNVDANGNAQVQTQAGSADFAKGLKGVVVGYIQDEMRPGGLLMAVGR